MLVQGTTIRCKQKPHEAEKRARARREGPGGTKEGDRSSAGSRLAGEC
jgi:hypothetical protein